jgi:transposase-like protein
MAKKLAKTERAHARRSRATKIARRSRATKIARGKSASVRKTSTRTSSKEPHPRPLPTRGRGAERASLAEARVKGGPVPGTPSPMRTRMTPELQAHVKRLYEQAGQPVCQIALDVGVDESTIRRMAKREEWVRFMAPPRDLPPVATLLAQVEELEKAGADPGTPTPNPSPQGGGEKEENIARFTQVVMAHLDEFEAVRRAGKLIARQHLPTARAISILTEAFNKLQRLRAAQPGQSHDDSRDRYASDVPADLDEYRLELTRRIRQFLESRSAGRGDSRTNDQPAEGI